MNYFAILTLELPGSASVTVYYEVTLTSPATRAEVYEEMRKSIVEEYGPRFATATVLFFSVEPNRLAI
jgi:hypothetical protein